MLYCCLLIYSSFLLKCKLLWDAEMQFWLFVMCEVDYWKTVRSFILTDVVIVIKKAGQE